MGEIAAVMPLISAGANIAGGLMANNSAAQTQAQIANNNLINTQSQQRYQQQLNAEAMRRAIAGVTDANGNRMFYDPATNTWRSELSPRGQNIQNSIDNATVTRNTTEFNRQMRSNEGAERRALSAETAAQPLLETIKRRIPADHRALEGNLQEASTLANREAYRPVIDSTLRQFARAGTAAGPVLSNIASSAATNLRRSMLDNVIRARSATADINNSERGGLVRDFAALNRESVPAFNYAPISSDGPVNTLTNVIASRSNSAAAPAMYGAASVPGMTNAYSIASNAAMAAVPNSNLLSAQLIGLGNSLSNNGGPLISALQRLLSGNGGGNAGDIGGGYWDAV